MGIGFETNFAKKHKIYTQDGNLPGLSFFVWRLGSQKSENWSEFTNYNCKAENGTPIHRWAMACLCNGMLFGSSWVDIFGTQVNPQGRKQSFFMSRSEAMRWMLLMLRPPMSVLVAQTSRNRFPWEVTGQRFL